MGNLNTMYTYILVDVGSNSFKLLSHYRKCCMITDSIRELTTL